ncbi:unnamed protein product [Rotaria socialis]|uniref:Reverse transcriptase domain-containing protein n=1 Tax=Rotaria socialis TaxID=392032 RepID=A0A820EIX3_9BILA|nr:unnamed protein product [Rotaria socialis]CAF4247056.1 unnamed protein product [Rotaria socialis]
MVNMDLVEQFTGTECEKNTIISILNEWNFKSSVSDLCKSWKKDRPKQENENIVVILYNCEGLSTHMCDLDILLSSHLPHIVVLTGVGKQLRNMPKIPSFYWESVEGSNSFGGVAILLHQSISSKIIEKQENFLMLEIETENEKILLGGIYVPPKSKTPFELFEKHVGKNFFIFGDYNAKHVQWNCSNNNTSGNEIKEWMDQNGCEMTHPLSTTSKRSEAIIDFMIAQDITGWNCEVLEVGTSDHYPIIYTSPFSVNKNSSFRKTNWSIFSFLLKCLFKYFNCLVYNIDHDAFFELFSNFLSGLWDRCSIYESVEKYRPPWPQHLILLAKTVNKHKRKYRKTHYVRHYEEWAYWYDVYQKEKINYEEKKRNKKLLFLRENNNIWKVARPIFKKYTPPFRGLKTPQGIERDHQKICDNLADYYEKHFSESIYNINNAHHTKCREAYTQISYTPNIPLQKIKIEDVIKQWKKFKPKKSMDSVNTSAFLLKNLPTEYFQVITVLFNKCPENGTFFERAKHARGVCLSKDGVYPTEDRLRSISLLPNIGKWFEKIIAERVENWCLDNGLNLDEQSGFIANRRLQTRILSLIEDIRLTVAAPNRPVLAIFIDFLTAFDRLWYPALFKTFNDLDMPLDLRRWIYGWLQNRSMTISHGDAESRVIGIFLGAPQGSVLAALLFRIHIHFLPGYFTQIVSHLFADDLTIVIKGALERRLSDNIKYLEKQAKEILKSLEKFADDYILPVNVSKTKAMVIHSAVVTEKPKIEYKNVQIKYVKSFKYLGIEIGTKLGWGNFVNNRLKKVRNIYAGLKKMLKAIPKDEIKIRKRLFCAYALPHFIWLFATWFFYTEKQQATIEHVYGTGIRIIYNMWGWDDLTTLALTQEFSLRDYIYKYWVKFEKHLEQSLEAVLYQQTWTAFLIATCPSKIYYKSCGFRKNAKFPQRLSEKARHTKLDLLTFFNVQRKQLYIYKYSSSILEWFILKYFPQPP